MPVDRGNRDLGSCGIERAGVCWWAAIYTYDLADGWYADGSRPADYKDGADTVSLIASHQDQVVELPAVAEVIARTDHCPVAAFTVGPRAFAIQPHPEFSAEVSRGLIGLRRGVIGHDLSDAALASLDDPLEHDRQRVAAWMANFWRQ